MSVSFEEGVLRHGRIGEPKLVPMEGKRILACFAVCCPMGRPAGGGADRVVTEVHHLPPDTSDFYVWVAGWDCQFTEAGSIAAVERLVSHLAVQAYAFRKNGRWFIEASMILASDNHATHWSGWIDLMGIAVG